MEDEYNKKMENYYKSSRKCFFCKTKISINNTYCTECYDKLKKAHFLLQSSEKSNIIEGLEILQKLETIRQKNE